LLIRQLAQRLLSGCRILRGYPTNHRTFALRLSDSSGLSDKSQNVYSPVVGFFRVIRQITECLLSGCRILRILLGYPTTQNVCSPVVGFFRVIDKSLRLSDSSGLSDNDSPVVDKSQNLLSGCRILPGYPATGIETVYNKFIRTFLRIVTIVVLIIIEVIVIAYKERIKPEHLRILEILLTRTKISRDDYYYFLNLKKGFEGELVFDAYTKQFKLDHFFLNDLQLEIRRAPFQVDALMIRTNLLILYEIKNFEGIYKWGAEKFTKTTGTELENPSLQLQKTKVRLELLLQEKGYSLKVDAYVIFVNPEFTLLGTPNDSNFILPSQIPGHFRNIQAAPELNAEQIKLAETLMNLHDSSYPRKKTQYTYSDLKKGITCPECGTLAEKFSGYSQVCTKCGNKMNVNKAIRSSIEDFHTLFPEIKLTSRRMMDWCGCGNDMRVYRVLKKNYRMIGKNRGRYYI
jgi:hypothetical protein